MSSNGFSIPAVNFMASIATGPTAWQISGDDPPSAKLRLEIPASEITKVLPVILWGEKPLKVTIEVEQ